MMDFAFSPLNLKFHTALDAVRKKHPYTEEIALMDLGSDVQVLLHQIDGLDGLKLKNFAVSLQNSRLELIFHALIQEVTPEQKKKLLTVLSLRMKKRFFHYNWAMLQDHYANASLRETFTLLKGFMKDRFPAEYEGALASKISVQDNDLIDQSLTVLVSEQSTINVFFSRYGIIRKSAYACALLQGYFLKCTKEGFHANCNVFIEWLRESEAIPYPQINHYLAIMNVLEYVDEINNFLFECYDKPGKSKFWDSIEEANQTKIMEWSRLRNLAKYLGLNTDKYLFWKNYYQYIEKIEWYPELGMLFLHIPGHVVVDFNNKKSLSYLYKTAVFHSTCKEFDSSGGFAGQTTWLLDTENIEPMKNAILENQDSDIYELTYERLGKLYIRDYLDRVL